MNVNMESIDGIDQVLADLDGDETDGLPVAYNAEGEALLVYPDGLRLSFDLAEAMEASLAKLGCKVAGWENRKAALRRVERAAARFRWRYGS